MPIRRSWTKGNLRRRSRQGHKGYPVATIAFYGPTAKKATKVAVGIIPHENAEADQPRRWHSETDVRPVPGIGEEILSFLREGGVKSVVLAEEILGCPHEEGPDYPVGESCPECPYWANRDRFSGELIQ